MVGRLINLSIPSVLPSECFEFLDYKYVCGNKAAIRAYLEAGMISIYDCEVYL